MTFSYFFFQSAAALSIAFTLTTASAFETKLTDDEIRVLLIRQSIASYSGSCPCPDNVDRAGRRCGARSAYSKPGGQSPLCYREDVTKEMIAEYRVRGVSR